MEEGFVGYDFLVALAPEEVSFSVAFAGLRSIEITRWFIVGDHVFGDGYLITAGGCVRAWHSLVIILKSAGIYRGFLKV